MIAVHPTFGPPLLQSAWSALSCSPRYPPRITYFSHSLHLSEKDAKLTLNFVLGSPLLIFCIFIWVFICKIRKKTFLILQMKTHIRDNHAEYWKFETSGGLFQINATNVRNRQFVEDILANTRGRSMCRGDNDPPKEGEFVMKWFHLASECTEWRTGEII